MSKTKLKKYLQTLTHEQIVQVVMDLYDARKAAKEYLEFFMDPNPSDALEKAKKQLLRLYFTPQGAPRARVSTKEGNDLIADFIKLDIDPEMSSDLMMYHAEIMISRLVLRHIHRETAWNSVITAFRKAIDYIISFNLSDLMNRRIEKFLDYSLHSPDYLRIPERLHQELDETGFNLSDDE